MSRITPYHRKARISVVRKHPTAEAIQAGMITTEIQIPKATPLDCALANVSALCNPAGKSGIGKQITKLQRRKCEASDDSLSKGSP